MLIRDNVIHRGLTASAQGWDRQILYVSCHPLNHRECASGWLEHILANNEAQSASRSLSFKVLHIRDIAREDRSSTLRLLRSRLVAWSAVPFILRWGSRYSAILVDREIFAIPIAYALMTAGLRQVVWIRNYRHLLGEIGTLKRLVRQTNAGFICSSEFSRKSLIAVGDIEPDRVVVVSPGLPDSVIGEPATKVARALLIVAGSIALPEELLSWLRDEGLCPSLLREVSSPDEKASWSLEKNGRITFFGSEKLAGVLASFAVAFVPPRRLSDPDPVIVMTLCSMLGLRMMCDIRYNNELLAVNGRCILCDTTNLVQVKNELKRALDAPTLATGIRPVPEVFAAELYEALTHRWTGW